MNDFNAITTVYSYYLPEVRAAIDGLIREFPHEVFLRSTEGAGLDAFHEPIIDKLVVAHRDDVPGLDGFANRYPTAGSEEGIREYFTNLALAGVREAYMFEGDYEGYREVARTRGITMREVPWGSDPASVPPGHWFLSDPCARDGNIVPPAVVRAICDAGHTLFYDLSYLGSTEPASFDVSHPNIAAVAISFSKPYGLFYYRIGFLFSRLPVPALTANKWFKNVFSLLVADRVLDTVGTGHVAAYKDLQWHIVDGINDKHGLGLSPSDAFLLAYRADDAGLSPGQRERLEKFRRGDGYRFCLTRYFLTHEKASR